MSNLYNNLSNTYLLMKRGTEAAKVLRTAYDIRMEYAHLGLTESHDSLQQMINLINMLLLAKDMDNAKIVLEQYELLVLEHLSDTSHDYVKTTYKYLNNLYARWNKPEKAIEYRDKYFSNRITTNKIHFKED